MSDVFCMCILTDMLDGSEAKVPESDGHDTTTEGCGSGIMVS